MQAQFDRDLQQKKSKNAAVESPAPVLTAALYERFGSRGQADFANKVMSAMRFEFGGHEEKGDTAKEDTSQTHHAQTDTTPSGSE